MRSNRFKFVSYITAAQPCLKEPLKKHKNGMLNMNKFFPEIFKQLHVLISFCFVLSFGKKLSASNHQQRCLAPSMIGGLLWPLRQQ